MVGQLLRLPRAIHRRGTRHGPGGARSAKRCATAYPLHLRRPRRQGHGQESEAAGRDGELVLTALIPTMDGPVRRLLVPNNNFAPRTIQGELERRNPKWIVHRVDATVGPERKPRWESKYPDDHFVQIEHDLGTIAFEAEYNNRPWVEGKVFTQEMIDRVWAPLPPLSKFRHITGRWDPAYSGKNDFNCRAHLGAVRSPHVPDSILRAAAHDEQHARLDPRLRQPAAARRRRALARRIAILERALRRAIAESNTRAGRQLNISVVPSPKTKKIDRLLSVYPYYENGRIRYNERERNDADFIEGIRQLLGIEPGYRTHDDSPDADERRSPIWRLSTVHSHSHR